LVIAFWLGLAMLIFLSGLAGSSRAKKAVQALTALALLSALFAYSLRYGSAVLSDAGLGVSTVAMLLVVALVTAVIRSSGKVGHRKSGQAEWVGQPAE
jgi:MFS superfamily sulfate permease-like transporter